MTTSYIFRSTDEGAPVMANDTPGDLLTVLKSVLVTGYGTKDPLGWSIEYEDVGSFQIVLRAPEGTRFPIHIDNSNSTTTGYALAKAFESMASLNDGILQTPPVAEVTYKFINCGSSTNVGVVPWIIIGDTKGFYLFAQGRYASLTNDPLTSWRMTYIGDYTTFHPENVDTFNFLMHLDTNTTTCVFYPGTTFNSYVMRDPTSFVTGSIKTRPYSYIYNSSKSCYGMMQLMTGIPNVGGKTYQPIYIHNYALPQHIFGQYPGLYEPIGPGDNFDGRGTELEPYFEVSGTNKLLMVPISRGATTITSALCSRVAIKVGEGFRNVI